MFGLLGERKLFHVPEYNVWRGRSIKVSPPRTKRGKTIVKRPPPPRKIGGKRPMPPQGWVTARNPSGKHKTKATFAKNTPSNRPTIKHVDRSPPRSFPSGKSGKVIRTSGGSSSGGSSSGRSSGSGGRSSGRRTLRTTRKRAVTSPTLTKLSSKGVKAQKRKPINIRRRRPIRRNLKSQQQKLSDTYGITTYAPDGNVSTTPDYYDFGDMESWY